MSYFSRLTDIVTCNLSEILRDSDDPCAAIVQVIAEMEEGLSGCERCVSRAERAATELQDELRDYARQISDWMQRAGTALAGGDEQAARVALLRKKEVEDLVAGLEREHAAAVATHESLKTTLRALEARICEARRRHQELSGTGVAADESQVDPVTELESTIEATRAELIEQELEELRRQLQGEGGLPPSASD